MVPADQRGKEHDSARYSRQVLNPRQACRHCEHAGDFHGELPPAAEDSPDYSLGILGAKWREVFSGPAADDTRSQLRAGARRRFSINLDSSWARIEYVRRDRMRFWFFWEEKRGKLSLKRKQETTKRLEARGACLELLCITFERLSDHTCGE